MAGKKQHPKFQTVEWWIEQLKEFNPKAVVQIATCFGDTTMAMASIYYEGYAGDENRKKVWIDIE